MSSKFNGPGKITQPPPVCKKPPKPPVVPPPWPPKGLCYSLTWKCPETGPDATTYTHTGTLPYDDGIPGYLLDVEVLAASLWLQLQFTNPQRTIYIIDCTAFAPTASSSSSSSSSSSVVPVCDVWADATFTLPGQFHPIAHDPVVWENSFGYPLPTVALSGLP